MPIDSKSDIELQKQQIEEQNRYLEKIKIATLNLLEDLSKAKSDIEEKNLRDNAILESIGEGIFAVDKEGFTTIVNSRAKELLGLSDEEIFGNRWVDVAILQHEDGRPLELEERPLYQALQTGERVAVLPLITPSKTYYFVRKDKKRFPVEIVASPVVLNGETVGVVEVFRDITREKEIERVKTEFVSIASHQLRTPLSTINWYTEMLLNKDAGEVNPLQKDYLQEIATGNKRMIDLVNSLLNVSRLEVGAFIVEPGPVSLIALVKEVLGEAKSDFEAKKIVVTEEYEKDLPSVEADPALVRIIFQNLIFNAVKYTPANGKISIAIKKQDEALLIKISDNGIGIPRSVQEKIFTKLFRADNAREADPEGTGLGLYIIKSIIDQTGGKIWFESEEGKGTTFYMLVPIQWMSPKKGSRKLV